VSPKRWVIGGVVVALVAVATVEGTAIRRERARLLERFERLRRAARLQPDFPEQVVGVEVVRRALDRPREEVLGVPVARVVPVVFIIGGLSPLASGMPQRIGANVLALVTFLYLLQGLAIFRSFLAATGAGFTGVFFAYVLLGLLTLTGIGPLVLSYVQLQFPTACSALLQTAHFKGSHFCHRGLQVDRHQLTGFAL